jgi:isopentenyl phosphate kinase
MFLVKLGGSVITDKTQYKRFNHSTVRRLCQEIKESGREVLIVHGAGSFGHVLAHDHHLAEGKEAGGGAEAIAKVSLDVRELNAMVVSALIEAGIPAVSIPPGACFMMSQGRLRPPDMSIIRAYLQLGIVPVTFGDLVLDDVRGFGICSGDQLMEVLADEFQPERVVFISDIDGLYDRDPKKDRGAKLMPRVDREALERSTCEINVKDVTGGVHGKMESMLRLCRGDRDCVLVNGTVEGRLLSLLKGDPVTCTVARGD